MTYHFKIYGHNDIIQYKVMLRQEMESYPIIILAWAHNKDDNKVISMNVVGRLVNKSTCCCKWGSWL